MKGRRRRLQRPPVATLQDSENDCSIVAKYWSSTQFQELKVLYTSDDHCVKGWISDLPRTVEYAQHFCPLRRTLMIAAVRYCCCMHTRVLVCTRDMFRRPDTCIVCYHRYSCCTADRYVVCKFDTYQTHVWCRCWYCCGIYTRFPRGI